MLTFKSSVNFVQYFSLFQSNLVVINVHICFSSKSLKWYFSKMCKITCSIEICLYDKNTKNIF